MLHVLHSNIAIYKDFVILTSAPDWFDDEWVSKIRHDTGDNRRLKVSQVLSRCIFNNNQY